MKLIRMERIEAADGNQSCKYGDMGRLFSVVTGLNPHHNRVNPVAGGGRNKQDTGLSLPGNQAGCGSAYDRGGTDSGRRLDTHGMMWTLSAIAKRECGSSLFLWRMPAALRLVCRGVFFVRCIHMADALTGGAVHAGFRAQRFHRSVLPTCTVPLTTVVGGGGSINSSYGA